MTKMHTLTKGLVKENPVLISMLGLCPVLAVTSQVIDAVGMGLAATFVLIGTNIFISALRGIIPDKVRIPCYIVLIAGLVTVVQMLIEAYAYPLYLSLGIFLPLIAVNCVIFVRAELFAKKNTVAASAMDALGMGAGFTLALLAMATVRESLGSGTLFGLALPALSDNAISIFEMAPGGFVVFGGIIAVVNKISKGRAIKRKTLGCDVCPSAAACGKGGAE